MSEWISPPEIAVAAALVLAAMSDWRNQRIPNQLTLAIALGGLLYQLVPGVGLSFIEFGFALIFAAALTFPLYAARIIAAGDTKLLLAIGFWLAPTAWLGTLIYALVAGAVLGVATVVWRGQLQELFMNLVLLVTAPQLQKSSARIKLHHIPFAVAIGLGFIGQLVVPFEAGL